MATPETCRIDTLLQSYIDTGITAGISAYVERSGKALYRGEFGPADIETARPVRPDTIFRIFSMSKVVTSVAALILFERGLYKMYDPVSRFIPAFKNPTVYAAAADGKVFERPAAREIRVRDLFTMTSGIPYGGDNTPTEKQMKKAFDRLDAKAKKTGVWPTTRERVEEAGRLPLEFDPGDHWKYGFSIDVLGGLVEVLSGKTLGEFMRDEILDPLGMTDTGFYVPAAKMDRFASMYPVGSDGRIKSVKIEKMDYTKAPAFESGGGGLVSTIDDYAAFARMLLTGKTVEGRRILGRKTIDLMRSSHLTAAQAVTYDWDTQRGYSYGLGVRTLTDPARAGCSGSVGEFGWDGYAGTWFCVDPTEDLIAIFMTQRAPGGHIQTIPPFKAALYSML